MTRVTRLSTLGERPHHAEIQRRPVKGLRSFVSLSPFAGSLARPYQPMVFLCSLDLELGGRTYSPFPKGSHFTMRWGSHLPLLTVLALVFVIPHDPLTQTL